MTRERIVEIQEKMKAGLISLPKTLENEKLSMLDSGSAPNVADHEKHFPGAELKESTKNGKDACTTATGDPFGAKGELTVRFKTEEGHRRQATFQNAPVMCPILSTGKMTDEDNHVNYRKWGGYIYDTITKEKSAFVRAHGVYWIKMIMADGVLKPKPVNSILKTEPQDFHGRVRP